MSKRHHIARNEARRNWIVLFKRSPRSFRKSFLDRRYGSKAAALAEAIAYRDRLLGSIPDWSIHQQPSSRNKSGIIGVSLVYQRCGTRVDRFWKAHWKENGRHRARAFGVKRRGYRQAKALAVALRREKVGEALSREAPPLARQPLPPKLRKPLSNTGVLGVCRRIIRGGAVYVAYWKENGEERQRSFSASRYGDSQALALAIRTRRAHEEAE